MLHNPAADSATQSLQAKNAARARQVTDIMRQNIEAVVDRGEHLELLVDKSDHLNSNVLEPSQTNSTSATAIQRNTHSELAWRERPLSRTGGTISVSVERLTQGTLVEEHAAAGVSWCRLT